MHTGFHLRFLKVTDVERSIEEADIVRVPPIEPGAYSFGVQLHAQPASISAQSDDIVLRLTRRNGESEGAFVKRAFREAADRQRQLQ